VTAVGQAEAAGPATPAARNAVLPPQTGSWRAAAKMEVVGKSTAGARAGKKEEGRRYWGCSSRSHGVEGEGRTVGAGHRNEGNGRYRSFVVVVVVVAVAVVGAGSVG